MNLAGKSLVARYLLVLCMITVPTVQGCTAAAVAYGVSKISSPRTEAPPAAPYAQRTYPEYLTEMERINLEREKAGLAPRPILTQEEWVAARAAGHTPAAPAPPAPVANPGEKAVESK